MRTNKGLLISLGVLLVALTFVFYFFLWPAAHQIYSDIKRDETRVAYRDNYSLHTTPLSESIVKDLCVKINISKVSESCEPDSVVYAPALFDELKTYFKNLPKQDQTYETVESKLGPYLVSCEHPDADGDFRCEYDFQGDHVYPVFFYFDKKGFYWRIIANTGGDS